MARLQAFAVRNSGRSVDTVTDLPMAILNS